ncbi:DUF4179 domain-containing protein [Arabiibacter massiliensis]|uniref:DUF4179 domain-containing protein n=1 Tax=Arabiibacter massiliensis TaxID=1870985 RepID=UPI0009B9D7A4|nr:DUF4179 domain-containing protein [Arabiibacter massiliensis]
MSDARREQEEKLNRALAQGLDAGPVPPRVQAGLDETYASLGSIPQERPQGAGVQAQAAQRPYAAQPTRRSGRVVRRGAVVAAAAVLVVLLSGAAFAATTLLQMQPGDVPFFGSGKNLPIYGSLQEGVSSLNAEVGQTVEVDGVRVTLDTVSSDRNIVNLFFTLEKEGGFDLSQLANYEGSQENEWSRLQRLAPRFTYTLTSAGEQLGTGQARLLDAYQEGDTVKVMQRIVPEATLPDQTEIALEGWASWKPYEEGTEPFSFDVGLDLSTVAQPRELGAQDLVFPTSDGDKTMGILRFTASELGTVMVVRNDNAWTGEPMTEGSSYDPPENVLPPELVKMTDDKGNVLNFVNAGDGAGHSLDAPVVAELSGLASDATSVTFTPMTKTDAAKAGQEPDAVEARKAMNAQNEPRSVDVSQIGTKLETSEFGGYEVVERSVADRTIAIKLKPFGWVPGGLHSMFELIPDEDVTYLASEWTNPETGETEKAYHSAIRYSKYDYLTGDLVQMDSYYAASDEELQGLTQYSYSTMFGYFVEDADAAQTLSF